MQASDPVSEELNASTAAAASDRNVQVQRARGPACRSAAGWMSFRAALAVNSSSCLISWIDRQIAGK
jgi:hypothetical protein